MKKRKLLCILIIPFLLILFVILFFQIQIRTVSKYFSDIPSLIYVPRGIANTYTDLLGLSIDEHKIWHYKLNSSEKEEIEKELDNEIWNQTIAEAIPEIDYFFKVNSVSYLPENIYENSYYCIYDFSLKRFIDINENVSILGWHRALFVYDKENSRYYCVSLSI